MRHCVATYAQLCARQRTSIWSMQVENQRRAIQGLDHRSRPDDEEGLPGPQEVQSLAPGSGTGGNGRLAVQEGLKIAEDMPLEPHRTGKVAVVGHTPQTSSEVLDAGFLICLDAFCCGGGWLTALDVTSGQVWQTNRDGRRGLVGSMGFPRTLDEG